MIGEKSQYHLLAAADEGCLADYDSGAGGGGAPFAHHRKQDGGREEGKREASSRHGQYYLAAGHSRRV